VTAASRRDRSRASGQVATVIMEDVREHLMSWRTPALVDLVMQHAAGDDRLRDSLRMLVAARLAGGDLGTLHGAARPCSLV